MLFRELTREEAMEISRLDGFDEGMSQGLEQGLEQGRAEAVIEFAEKMKAKGESIEKISEYTGLSAEEIQAL